MHSSYAFHGKMQRTDLSLFSGIVCSVGVCNVCAVMRVALVQKYESDRSVCSVLFLHIAPLQSVGNKCSQVKN